MLSRLLFERAWLLLIILAAIQFVMIAIWWWRRTHRSARAVRVGFVILIVLPALSMIVVTSRERIIELCKTLAQLVDAGDVVAIGHHIGHDFELAGLDREGFLQRVEQTLMHHDIDGAVVRGFDIVLTSPDQATAELNAACSVSSADAYVGRLLTKWRLQLRRTGSDWLVTHVQAVPTPLSPIRKLDDWLK